MVKTDEQLLQDFAANQDRGIVSEDVRNLIDSLRSVGGTMYGSGSQQVTPSWTEFTAFTNSVDTKGVTADLNEGEFVIEEGAGGTYAVDATVSLKFPASGRVDVALTKNGALTPYRSVIDVVANKLTQFNICGTGPVVATDRVGLAIKGSGSAVGTVESCQFRAFRF